MYISLVVVTMMNLGTPLQLICDIIDGVCCTVVLDKYYITTEIRECSNIRLSECSTSWVCIKDTEYRLCEGRTFMKQYC